MKKHLLSILFSLLIMLSLVLLASCGGPQEPVVFDIEYVLAGGELPDGAPAFYSEGDLPEFDKLIPIRTNYEFAGWYTDSAFKTELSPADVSGAIKLYAKWNAAKFRISYELAGGECEGLPELYTYGERTSLVEFTPTMAGRLFDGWYADADFTEHLPMISKDSTGDITVYAKWRQMAEKIADIPDITKGYFGAGYSTYKFELDSYVKDNGAAVSYTFDATDKGLVTGSVSNGVLTLTLANITGSSSASVTVSADGVECFKLEFNITTRKYATIACVGDSLTATMPAYPAYLPDVLGDDIVIENYGKSGASLTEYSNNTDIYGGQYKVYAEEEYRASLESKADLIIIMLGTNDATKLENGLPKYNWNTVAPAYKSEYLKLIEEYRTANPSADIIIMTSPAVLDNNRLSIDDSLIENNIYPLQLEIAEEAGVKLLDLRAYLSSLPEADAIYVDGVHFDGNGAMIIAEYIASSI